MKKISSLFKRSYDGDRLVYNEVVPGSEWVLKGKGVPTEKFDGTSCMILDGQLFRRYDRRSQESAVTRKKRVAKGELFIPSITDYKLPPPGWIDASWNCEPDYHTGHWPGWVPVGMGPDDEWHREAFQIMPDEKKINGTYELIGPKIQGNPYKISGHQLGKHGLETFLSRNLPFSEVANLARDFGGIKDFLQFTKVEGIVWHLENSMQMVKIKRKDFGFPWPPERS